MGLSGGQGGNDVCYQEGEADGGGGQDGPESYQQHANFLNMSNKFDIDWILV